MDPTLFREVLVKPNDLLKKLEWGLKQNSPLSPCVKSSTGIKYPAKTIIFGYCPILLKIISQTNKYLYYDLQLGSYINLDTEHHPKILSQFYRLIQLGPHGNWKKVTSAPDNPLKGSNWIRNISQGYFMQ